MYKTRILSTRTLWAPVEDRPGWRHSIGEEKYWKEKIVPDFAKDASDEVVEELGDDKKYILAELDKLNKEMDNEKLLAFAKRFDLVDAVDMVCDIEYRGVVNHADDIRKLLDLTDEEVKHHLFANKWCVVTRSDRPSKGTPWKQFGRRTFCWVVPMTAAYENTGRRIEWGGDTKVFNTRREALTELYGG